MSLPPVSFHSLKRALVPLRTGRDVAKLASSSGTDTDCTDKARDAAAAGDGDDAAALGIRSRWSGSRCACIPLCYN